MRYYDTGATRDSEEGKLDYEGFLSPRALKRFAQYMDVHRHQADGEVRDSDNWQKGIPIEDYMKSMWRHFMDVWTCYRAEDKTEVDIEDALCAVMFNVQGMLHEIVTQQVIPMSSLTDVTGTEEVLVYQDFKNEPHESGFHTHPKDQGWAISHAGDLKEHDLFRLHYHMDPNDENAAVVYMLKPGEKPTRSLGALSYDEGLGAYAEYVYRPPDIVDLK